MARVPWSLLAFMLMIEGHPRVQATRMKTRASRINAKSNASADSTIIHVVTAMRAIDRQNDRMAQEANARLERDRRLREERDRRERARRKQEAEEHMARNKQDCQVSETWSEAGPCSASCGGGVKTSILEFRTVTKERDRFGYGKACPPTCDEKSKTACGEPSFETCAVDPCPTDCSYIDLGSRLPGSGTPTEFEFTTADGIEAKCVFQFWQVLEGSRLRLLGETTSIEEGGPGKMSTFSGDALPVMIHSTSDYADIRLGFRGCNVLRKDGQPATEVIDESMARVCLYGDAAFDPARQTVKLDRAQTKFLDAARQSSRRVWAGMLANAAAGKSGVSKSDVVHIGAEDPFEAQFELAVSMSPQPPTRPKLNAIVEVDDNWQLDFKSSNLDNGSPISGYSIQVRKIHPGNNGGRCTFIDLPVCAIDNRIACVDDHFILRNLPFASNFELRIRFKNEVGYSRGAYHEITTRARSGVPLKDCWVTSWECGDSEVTVNMYPEQSSDECKLTTIGLPTCRMKPRKNWLKQSKCDGKKYWQTCEPIMRWKRHSPECAQIDGKFPQQICTHVSEEGILARKSPKNDPEYKPDWCEKPGCSTSALGLLGTNKHCCCLPGQEASAEADSPYCACEKRECAALGLADATDPSVSCRH